MLFEVESVLVMLVMEVVVAQDEDTIEDGMVCVVHSDAWTSGTRTYCIFVTRTLTRVRLNLSRWYSDSGRVVSLTTPASLPCVALNSAPDVR